MGWRPSPKLARQILILSVLLVAVGPRQGAAEDGSEPARLCHQVNGDCHGDDLARIQYEDAQKKAEAQALKLAQFLKRLIAEVSPRVDALFNSGTPLQQAKRAVFSEAFGPRLDQAYDASGRLVYGGVFRTSPADPSFPFGVRTVDETPILALAGISGTNAFFYESTLVDLRTGSVYQTAFTAREPEVYGPLVPPEEARLKGYFGSEDVRRLEAIIFEALWRWRRQSTP